MKNLLLIDSEVRDYQTFVDSVNADTIPFVYTLSTTRQDLLDFIGYATIDRMGIVFSHTRIFLEGLFLSDSNTTFFIDTIRRCQIKNLDFLACDTLIYPDWKAFYDNLHTETGIVIGASDNPTGNIKYGGDWILESTSEDIEFVYFKNTIEYYKYLLGNNFTMIVKTDGKIWGAGYNGQQNLANGDTTDQNSFVNVTALQSTEFQGKTVNLLKCGNNFTFALMTDKTLWGAGYSERVGVTTINNKFAIVPISGTIVSLDCGSSHTVLYTSDNKLWGVGWNYYGQLGSSSGDYNTFTQITGITGTIKAVACGAYHTIVLTTSNKLWVTGANFYGDLGVGDTNHRYSFTLVNIDTISGKIPDLIAGSEYSNFISMTDGTIWKPSNRAFAQVSNTNNYFNGLRKPIKFAGVYYHSFVLMSDGTVWGFGDSNYLGPNLTGYPNDFIQMTIPTTIKSIWGGMQYSILLGTNNTLYSTGINQYGQFGNGTTPSNTVIKTFVTSTTDVKLLVGDVLNTDPTISSITQDTSGLITLNGTNFTTPTVSISGGFTSGTITKVNSAQLTFTPNGFISNATFTLTDSGITVVYTASFPSITSITQASNGLITINGSNFTTPTVTMTGGYTSGTVTKVSSSQLTFTPSPTPITVNTLTFTLSDSGSSVSYIYSNITITSFTPSSGTKNTLVTITGSNFGNVTSVLFGTVAATNPIISSTTILVNAPNNNKSVSITLIGNGISVISSTNFTYNTNPTLFTSSTNDPSDKLLSELNLTDGIDNTGILNLGSSYTNINFSGAVNGITVNSGDNSSSLATTAFVKAQGYTTGAVLGSLTGYAQMASAQTWSAIQSFSSGILSSNYNALTATSTVSVANNLTTGILSLGTSTATMNLNVPLTPTYTAAPVSGQTGYTVTLAPLTSSSYQFIGGDLVRRYVPVVQGTYVATATACPAISLDYFMIYFAALKMTPSDGLNLDLYSAPDKLIFNAGLKATPVGTNVVLGGAVWSITSTMYIPAGYSNLALVTNTYKGPSGNSPFSTINTTMTVTRIS